jgi:lipoteichoic acid synthase
MSSDVIPTIYNLFGVEYDSRLFTGRDILSTEDGLAVFSNRSFRSDVGTYFTSGSKFVGEDINGYVANMKNVVKNRLNVAKLIIKTDYYKYLFK